MAICPAERKAMADSREQEELLFHPSEFKQRQTEAPITTGGSESFRESLSPLVVADVASLAPVSMTESAIRRTSPTPQQQGSLEPASLKVEPVEKNLGILRPRPRSGKKKGSNLISYLQKGYLLQIRRSSVPCQEDAVDDWVKTELPKYHGRAFVSVSVPEGSDPAELCSNSSQDQFDEAPLGTLRWSVWKQQSQIIGIRARLAQPEARIEIAPRSCSQGETNGINLRFENSTESLRIGTVTLYSHQKSTSGRAGKPTA